ncbi:MAG TPA: hypothetical protein VGN59_10925 [Acidimicrobiia bacterium]|jgi:hypothetical protein
MAAETRASDRLLGRWGVRLLALAGCFLVTVSAFGWWLDSRVLDDQGFADVVAKASQQPEVRDYVADQATLRLASSSNFVSGARPIVTDAVSNAIATPPVEDAIREFAARAHQQVFKTGTSQRVDIDAQQASTTIRSALQTINPSLSKKLPANVLDASATISQNSAVDTAFTISRWVWLWLPIGIVGIALLAIAMARARDRVRAIRTVGIVLAVSGALLAGVGAATPALAAVAANGDAARGEAVAAFIGVLIGRLVGAGLAFILIGLAVALAPGKDGGDLRDRVQRVRGWVERKRTSPRWRFAGGLALFLFAASVLTRPTQTARTLVELLAVLGLYVAVVICLRASGVLATDHSIPRLKKRQVAGVFGSMVVAAILTATVAVAAVAANTSAPSANPEQSGCNGYMELCPQPIDQLVWPASHNAMSSSAYNFLGAEHTITIPEQLNSGARFLMLDAYYGYDDNGIVRTNLAGGVDRKTLEKERGPDAVRALDRIGALTGTADTSGHKQDVYFCHDLCELGAVRASDVFSGVSDFLDRNLTAVVVLDLEDYVQPKDVRAALDDAGLGPRLLTLTPEQLHTKTLLDIVTPKKKQKDAPRRLIVVSEKHGGVEKWLPKTYSLFQETPYTFTSVKDFTCAPNRGGKDKPLLLINHWLRPDGPPDPTAASNVNSRAVLTKRFKACIARRKRLPNAVAVDFTSIGDFNPTINRFNAAVAKVTGVSDSIDRVVAFHRRRADLTQAQLNELKGLRRLPRISGADALNLLGPLAGQLVHPPQIDEFERDNGLQPPPVSTTTTVPAAANP